MDEKCKRELGDGPVTVKKSNSCIGKDDPISLDVLDESDDPLCLNGECYSFKNLKDALIRKPTDPKSRRYVKDPENILDLQVNDNNIIIKQRGLAARNIVRSDYNEQQARQQAHEFRQETINSLRSEPLPTNKRDKLRELMRRQLEIENLNSMLESLIRDAIETDEAIYQNQLEEANEDTAAEGLLMLNEQSIGGKQKKTKKKQHRKQHRKNKITKRLKKKHKKTRKK